MNAESLVMEDQEGNTVSSDLFPNKSLLELSKATWKNKIYTDKSQPYVRGCAWSPDGTCCLTIVNMDGQHVTELPTDLYKGSVNCDRTVNKLASTIHIKESGLIYDFCWYPCMNSNMPETCCWLTTRQHGPLQLWDGWSGGLRCTYRGYDAVDEMEPALCAIFSVDGARVYAGYKKCLRIFDSNRPGRDCVTNEAASPTSCLAGSQALLAAGSWNTTLGLYAVKETGLKCIGRMHGHSGGVTHAKFTRDGQRLVTGARKDDKLLVWDLRYYRRPLNVLQRRVDTNQRIYFDISPCGRYLVSGGTDGLLRVWDTMDSDWTSAKTDFTNDNPTFQFQLHNDCCNSVSIHPFLPIIATGSGQFHSRDPVISLADSTEDISSRSDTSFHQTVITLSNNTTVDQTNFNTNQPSVEINKSECIVEESSDNTETHQQLDRLNEIINRSNTVTQPADLENGQSKLIKDRSESTSDESESTSDESESEKRSLDESSDIEVSGEVKCENSLVFWWIGNVPDL